MIFLNPLFLLGLLAAGIPLVIHLFNFRRPQRVNFSSLAFLHELQKSTMQRVRIKQWLLLALRMLTIAALVLAFARPTLEGRLAGALGGGRTTTVLVVDNSTSMTLRDGSGAWLDQVRSVAAELVAGMERGDEVFVVPVMGERTSTPLALSTPSAVRGALDDLAPIPGQRRLTEALREAMGLVRERPTVNRQIYVASDLQASTLSDSVAVADSSADIRTFLLPVGSDGESNLAVTDVDVVSQIIAADRPMNLTATLLNAGSQTVEGLVASLFLEGERVAQATVTIPAGGQTSAEFVVTPRRTGWLKGRVEVDDPNYVFDNVRPFTVNVPEERRILLAGTGDDRFLALALSESIGGESVRFRTEQVAEDQLAATALGSFDAVVLSRVRDLSTGERAALSDYVRAGGGLLIFPWDGMAQADYNALLAELGGGSIEVPAAGAEAGAAGATAGGAGTAFNRVDAGHPLFEGMFAPEEGAGASGMGDDGPTLEQPTVFRSIRYTPRGVNEQTIIGMTNGAPFLQEIRSGQGLTLLFAVESGITWSDFPVRGLFVPLLYRSLYWLSSSESVMGEDAVVGTPLQIRVAGGRQVVVRSEEGDELIPSQRTLPGATLVDVSGPFFDPGVYDVASGTDVIRRFVIQSDPAESLLSLMDPDEAAAHLTELTGQDVGVLDIRLADSTPLEAQVAAARTGYELWNVFLGLALICMLLESILASRWRPESAS
ncbi:MAG: BatA and WFA domain-containing protein [Rhodothermales bacterium]